MVMFRGQINVIELIKAITLIMQSITFGQENFSLPCLTFLYEAWSCEVVSLSLSSSIPVWKVMSYSYNMSPNMFHSVSCFPHTILGMQCNASDSRQFKAIQK